LSERGYQYDFSKDNAAMHSAEGRRRKALTMLAVLHDALGEGVIAQSRVLNVGCSTGLIDGVLAEQAGSVVGIDIDQGAIKSAQVHCSHANLQFRLGDAMALDFPDQSFDVVICSQVYEHVPDPARMMAEISRVLAPDGVCYFAATNRLCIMEQHYHLPFLSVMPLSWANHYLRWCGRGQYYHERHMTLSGLRRLTAGLAIEDYTRRLLANPARYHVDYMIKSRSKMIFARLLSRFAYWALPGYIWILRKNVELPN
jgi:2-polyprenyl-3-methyl-5-hydroxy-6-metoxy-1,4-benzoquinol methylase